MRKKLVISCAFFLIVDFIVVNCVNVDPRTSLSDLETTEKWCHCWNNTEVDDVDIECRCHGMKLKRLPVKLAREVEKLTISEAGVEVLTKDTFQRYRDFLQDITLSNLQYLRSIEDGTFRKISKLRSLYISHAPLLKTLSSLFYGVTSKKFLSLRILSTGLEQIPDLSLLQQDTILHMVDLEGNKLSYLASNSIKVKAEQVLLSYNKITHVDAYAFNGSQIAKLKMKGNRHLSFLSDDSFVGLNSLQELDLSSTAVEHLPVRGLEEMEILRIQDTPTLKTIPSVYEFKNLKEAHLTHSFHCCAFKFPKKHNPEGFDKYIEKFRELCKVLLANNKKGVKKRNVRRVRSKEDSDENGKKLVITDYWHDMQYDDPFSNITVLDPIRGEPIGKILDSGLTEEEIDDEEIGTFLNNSVDAPTGGRFLCGSISMDWIRAIECYPEPDALNPCEDIMGSDWLRVSVWLVVITAVIGNLAVIIVFFSNMFDLNVPKFLMFNLAFADFCMGLYLFLIASMDLHSMEYYFNFAYHWQVGPGCKVAGFLTVFASQLSVFTLTIITLERWFAIRFAIYLNKRIRIGAASKIMLFGWFYSIFTASLPLFGISNYSSTSICLPMEAKAPEDMAYLATLLLTNGLAFLIICICYTQIYMSLGTDTRRSMANNEMTIAKKMFVLVATDFVCWAPIAFFGLTALAGYPLIDVTRSKILLVFFYPLNSCANPYLYAILTAQYRRDFFNLLYRCGLCKNYIQRYTLTNNTMQTTNRSNSNQSNAQPLLLRALTYQPKDKCGNGKSVREALV